MAPDTRGEGNNSSGAIEAAIAVVEPTETEGGLAKFATANMEGAEVGTARVAA